MLQLCFSEVFLRSLKCTKREAKKYNLKKLLKKLVIWVFCQRERERERERKLLKFRVITSMES